MNKVHFVRRRLFEYGSYFQRGYFEREPGFDPKTGLESGQYKDHSQRVQYLHWLHI